MLDLTTYEHLKLEIDEHRILTVTIDNPEQRNAISPGIDVEIHRIWREITADDSIRCVLLTAVGNRAFSAGGNIKGMVETIESTPKNFRGTFIRSRQILEDMLGVEQPIICALNGDAYGLGTSLAMMSDIIVANESAKIVDSHVAIGLVAGDGGVLAWPLAMSIYKAKEHLMRGTPLLASEAAQLGIINYALPYEEVLPKAREIAVELAHGAPWAIRWTKMALNKIARDRLQLVMDASLASEWITFMTDDHSEAARAFLERRKPEFKGT